MPQLTPTAFTLYGQYPNTPSTSGMGMLHPYESTKPPEKDILREGVLRYWGYINEIAESLKDAMHEGFSKFPDRNNHTDKIVKASYTAVWPYVGLDSLDKAVKGFKQAKAEGYGASAQTFSALEKGVDAFLFQCGASLYGPAFIVSIFRDYSKMALFKLFGNQKAVEHLKEEVQHTLQNLDKSKNSIELMPEKLKQWLFQQPVLDKLPSNMGRSLSTTTRMRIAKGFPILSSLALIPFLIHPIDKAMNLVLDISYRPLMNGLKQALFGQPIVLPPPQAKSALTFAHRNAPAHNTAFTSTYPAYRATSYQPSVSPATYQRPPQYPTYPSSFQSYSRL